MVSKKGLYTFWKILRNSVKDRKVKRLLGPDKGIRLEDKNGFYCPLTYVNYKKKGVVLRPYQYEEAAASLGIEKIYGCEIVNSADNTNFCDKRLRRKMLKVLKLKEANKWEA